jgi:RHS repeat-associated protein
VQQREHIVGGASILDHYSNSYFDGLGRTYKVSSTGPGGKNIVTETSFDSLGRVWKKSNPRFCDANDENCETRYDTVFSYDGLSRVVDTVTPEGYHITADYRGLKKIVTNQRGYATAYTYDVYQRLKKVEEDYNEGTGASYSVTEYAYNTLGNLTQVVAAKNLTEQNITTMTYDSLSKKSSMTDPDMDYWIYQYDKSGNLTSQTDAKSQTITFQYDCLNRLTQKVYPDRTVTFTYDDVSVGKLTKVSDPSGGEIKEDSVLEYDLMQRVKRSKKKIGAEEVTFERTYDSAGRAITIKYLAGTPNEKTYGYEYDVAGNLLYLKDNASGSHLVDYSEFTALGQPKYATFPKPSSVSVKTSYTYDPPTARLKTLLTQKLVNGSPTDTYQNLDYQQFDGKGNILTLADTLNGVTHTYTYDNLDRLLTAKGNNGSIYNQSYTYDRIGNITYKSDVGSYTYYYDNKPHAVRTAGSISLQYNDANGNMTQRVAGGITLDFTYTYDNKPSLIKKNTANYVQFTYDGNGERVKKYNNTTGQTVLYFGDAYEVRGGVGVLHLFAGSKRVASVWLSGSTQFYHTDHLGSSTVITDQNGLKTERNEYFPFGTYRESIDYDPNFPDSLYTFTGQEDDDDLGLYNFKARLYDPLLGRFITPDRLVPDPGDPQALNRYAYCQNNPIIYTDPSGEFFWLVPIGFLFGANIAYGAYTAYRAGESPLGGAFIAVVNSFISTVVGFGVGNIVTAALTPTVVTAADAGAVAAAETVGMYAGAFAGGATSGALNAAAYGGNVWQGALYGGLTAVAMLATIQGIIELTGLGNSSSGTVLKDPKTGKILSGEEVAYKIFGITDKIKQGAEDFWQRHHFVELISRDDPGLALAHQIDNICAAGMGCHSALDLMAKAWKFDAGTLHIRSFAAEELIRLHWDRYNMTVSFGNFFEHVWVDTIRNTYYAIKELGFWRGLAEGL